MGDLIQSNSEEPEWPSGYEFVSLISRNETSSQAVCIQVITGRKVLVKLLHGQSETDIKRFEREAKILAALEHENIQKVFAFGFSLGSQAYIVSEFLQGESLADLLARTNGTLESSQFFDLFIPLARALAFLHEKQIVHRNISPQSTFLAQTVDGSPLPKLIDFGSSRVLPENAQKTTGITELLKHEFRSPESGTSKESFASDVYSLGALMYYCLSGKATHANFALPALQGQEAILESLEVSNFPKRLRLLVASMLEYEQNKRPAAADVLLTLESVSKEEPASQAKSRKLLLAAGLLLILALLAVFFLNKAATNKQDYLVEEKNPDDYWKQVLEAREILAPKNPPRPEPESWLPAAFEKSEKILDSVIAEQKKIEKSILSSSQRSAGLSQRLRKSKLDKAKAVMYSAYMQKAYNQNAYLQVLSTEEREAYKLKQKEALEHAIESAAGTEGQHCWSHLAYYALAGWYLGAGLPFEAEPLYRKALELSSKFEEEKGKSPIFQGAPGTAYSNWHIDCNYRLGIIEIDKNQFESGAARLQKVWDFEFNSLRNDLDNGIASLKSRLVISAVYLSDVYSESGKREQANQIRSELNSLMLALKPLSAGNDSQECLLSFRYLFDHGKYRMAADLLSLTLPVYARSGIDADKWKFRANQLLSVCRERKLTAELSRIDKALKLLKSRR